MHLMPNKAIEIIGVVIRAFKRGYVVKSARFCFNRCIESGYQVIILNRDGTESVFSTTPHEGSAKQDRDLVLELIS